MKFRRARYPSQDSPAEQAFFDEVLALKSSEESLAFLRNLCTPVQSRSIAGRWMVAKLTREGYTHQFIYSKTGISLATIGRVLRSMRDGSGGSGVVHVQTTAAEELNDENDG